MRKYKNKKLKLLLILAILSILGIGIGYSALSEKLTIDSSVAINEMKWDIGFSAVEDNGGTVLSESTISEDGKTLTVLCDFGSSIKQKTCTVKATITNNSTFDVGLRKNPTITYDDTYIHTLTFKWKDHPTYENKTVLKDNFIAKGKSEEVILTIKSKFLDLETAPTEETTVPITITLDFAEWQQDTLPTKNDLAILESTGRLDTTAFRSATYKEKIKTITFENKINIPSDAIESWDIGVNPGKVMAYVVSNKDDSTYYDLYIQSDTQLYANINMNYWFYELTCVESINGLQLLDTSNVTGMYGMFYYTGHNNPAFTLDISNFDTSNVINMSYMFQGTGYSNPNFTLDVSSFDTSNVTNMTSMFDGTGYNSTIFTLDLSNFDTSKVTDMYRMFDYIGYNSTIFTLDLSNFDTSNVTDMSQMFNDAGYNSTTFTLDVSSFDTSNVTDMSAMFKHAGYNSTTFTLDVGNFDTSNVTDMGSMFDSTGYNSTLFTLDVSNFDTSNVTDMSSMFRETGYNSTKLNTSITIRNPNTTEYTNMFQEVATKTGSQITVNYTSETGDLVDRMIATKWSNSNVIKGVQVD